MILEKGDMWSVFGKTDFFCITTNPVIRKDGAVVMGRGIAKQMRDRFPDFAKHFGTRITEFRTEHEAAAGPHILHLGPWDNQVCVAFMVKSHWADNADPEIIKESARVLGGLAKDNPKWRFDLNFPGIGNGKLAREDVLPLLAELPDNVHVWEYGE